MAWIDRLTASRPSRTSALGACPPISMKSATPISTPRPSEMAIPSQAMPRIRLEALACCTATSHKTNGKKVESTAKTAFQVSPVFW
jgi:hypothetical protein